SPVAVCWVQPAANNASDKIAIPTATFFMPYLLETERGLYFLVYTGTGNRFLGFIEFLTN
ncbi:MAG: hypothetical protein AB1752_12620, partial [Candidatus Zixiibacteriota bacterium]